MIFPSPPLCSCGVLFPPFFFSRDKTTTKREIARGWEHTVKRARARATMHVHTRYISSTHKTQRAHVTTNNAFQRDSEKRRQRSSGTASARAAKNKGGNEIKTRRRANSDILFAVCQRHHELEVGKSSPPRRPRRAPPRDIGRFAPGPGSGLVGSAARAMRAARRGSGPRHILVDLRVGARRAAHVEARAQSTDGGLSANSPRLSRRPTTDDRRPTTDDRRPTTDDRRTTERASDRATDRPNDRTTSPRPAPLLAKAPHVQQHGGRRRQPSGSAEPPRRRRAAGAWCRRLPPRERARRQRAKKGGKKETNDGA